jgi:peptidoglycan/xylan/chitin deacetylase (PgdA/CDA1 family)
MGLLLIYTIIPTLFIRFFWGGFKKRSINEGIALTFDDGPDLEYTPQLLDLLKRHQVKATFFVLGSKAKQHPELIARMHQDGHLVGIHNYVHWANALMSPWKVRLQLQHSVKAVENIIGIQPVYYRPPWGIINLFDFFLPKRFRLVFWSVIVGDWRSRAGKYKLKARLLSKLKDGAVIVLHDSGQTFGADLDAPLYMLEALDEFIRETYLLGYSFITIDDKLKLDNRNRRIPLRWHKRLLVSIWLRWESLVHALLKLKSVDSGNPLLYYRICTYHGPTISLSSEESISSGDRIVELHLNNKMLFRMAADTRSIVQLAVMIIRSVNKLMPKITETMRSNPDFSGIKGIYGITMIYRGTNQLGFTVTDLPKGLFSLITGYYLRTLLYILHPDGKKRIETKSELLTPKIVVMSTKALMKRYPADEIIQDKVQVQLSYAHIRQ